MSFLKGLCGGAAGAAAYNMYQTTDLSSGGSVAATLFEAFQRKGAAQVAEVSRMHRQVEDLQSALLKSLHDRQPQTVVLHSGSKSGSTVAGVAVVVGGVVLYLRFVKGWKFADMMYVTKGALSSMQESVNSGISSMRSQVEAATSDLVARLSAVADKQEDLLGKQEEMDGELRDVGERVDGVAAGVEQLQVQVAYGNHAITMLCGALAEVAKRVGLHNGRYVRALDGLVHGAPQRISDGGAAGGQAVLQGVEPLLLLDSAALAPNSPERGGGPGPRPNPAVFVLAGDAGSGRAAAAVAAGAVPRHVTAPGSTFSGGPGAGGGSQQPASTWGRSVSESYRPKAS